MKKSKRVLSGIRPSGELHLGNYLGAVKGMISLQEDPGYESFYMVADAHAITTHYDKDDLEDNCRSVVLDYLAAGLDPEKSTIFIQSMIPQHFELSHYLSSVITVNRMQHLPTYKDKLRESPEEASMALLNYPILMAADILSYKADSVPVGVDQEPHLEIARKIARKMNYSYGTDFPEPEIFKTEGSYIPSLLGVGKMSKSVEGSYINLTDDLETIKDRLAKVTTDIGKGSEIPVKGSVLTLLTLVEMYQGKDKREEYESDYLGDGICYSELKDKLAQSVYSDLEPLQKRRKEVESTVDDVIAHGAEKAREVAERTLQEVKSKMGFVL